MSTLIMLLSLLVAIIFVPPYLWRMYKPYFADIMSNRERFEDDDEGVDLLVDQQATTALSVVAMPNNAINSALSGNDPIVFQVKVEQLAALIRSGLVTNKAKAIESAFGCSRSSKPESIYQRANKALEPLLQTGAQYMQPDGTIGPATHPISGRQPSRTHAR